MSAEWCNVSRVVQCQHPSFVPDIRLLLQYFVNFFLTVVLKNFDKTGFKNVQKLVVRALFDKKNLVEDLICLTFLVAYS